MHTVNLWLLLVQGEADVAAWVAKRVDMLLQQTARLGLRSRAACITYLGSSFRTPLQLSETKSDYAVSPFSNLLATSTPFSILLATCLHTYTVLVSAVSVDTACQPVSKPSTLFCN